MKYGFLTLFLAGAAQAQTTWYVDLNATPPGLGTLANPYASIQYAHDRPTTVNADTILVLPGTYHENLVLNKQVTVRSSAGAEQTILMPAGIGPIVQLNEQTGTLDVLLLVDFTITGLLGPANGCAVRGGEGTLVGCIVRGNRGVGFHGVQTFYDSNLTDCTVVDNDIGVECNSLGEALWLKNCIVWGNGTNVQSTLQPFFTDISYCAGGPFPFAFGPGIHVGDPGMWDVANHDYHLRPASVCIDSGDPGLPNDPDGSRSDIGYFAFDPLNVPVARYCTGKLNSDGCLPKIAGSGLPSASNPNPFLITATLLKPGRPSLLLYGFSASSAPFQGATLCLATSVRRVGAQISAGAGVCGGSCTFDFNLRVQSGADPLLVPGKLVYAQWWQRDPGDPAGFGSGLTNALRFGIGL